MNRLAAYNNSLWCADGERFQRCIHSAIHKPCPSAAQIRERHRELCELAKGLPATAVQGGGVDTKEEMFVEHFENNGDRSSDTVKAAVASGSLGVNAEAPRAIRATKGKIGIIQIFGPVAARMSGELDKAGGTPLDFVSHALDSLLSNASVGAIVLQFDTPGGSIENVQELADKIYAARNEKAIYAIADSCAASAGLWLASAASMFISTPGGGGSTVGSHGVFVMHVDESAAMEADGVKVTAIHAGKHKVEFSPYAPLSDDAKAEAQARVDGIYGEFTAALAKFRGKSPAYVRDNFGQGRMLTAAQGLSVGMIDRVLTMGELMGKLIGGSSSGAPSAKVMAMQFEHRKRKWLED